MRPVRAPLSTLLGLLLVRWLLACTQRLLTHLTLPGPEVQGLGDEVASEHSVSTPWHRRTALSLRRYSQRQRARYVKWRETDTAELAEQLLAQCDSLRDGVVTTPQVAADVSRKSNVSSPNDWTEKVRRRGARIVAPSTSPLQSSVTALPNAQTDALLVTDSPAPGERVPGALTETRVTPTADRSITRTATAHEGAQEDAQENTHEDAHEAPRVAVQKDAQEARSLSGVSHRPRKSNQRPTVIPVSSEPQINEVSRSQRDQPTAPAVRSCETQHLSDTTHSPETFGRTGSDSTSHRTAAAQRMPSVHKPTLATSDNWPSLPEQTTASVSGPVNQGVDHHADKAVASRWPSLPESNVPAEPRPATVSRHTARLEAEQSGTLWNE